MSTTEVTGLDIPLGAPNWMDLVTTDVDKGIEFYTQLFGWTCHETPPQFKGYRYFAKDGKAVGGCMLNNPEFCAANGWAIYLRSDDVRATAAAAVAHGGSVLMDPMDVDPNGSFVIVR